MNLRQLDDKNLGYWISSKSSPEKMNAQQVLDALMASERGIFCLDGPSMCGKTSILYALPNDKTEIITDEHFVDAIVSNYKLENPKTRHEMANLYRREIVCVDDIDFLAGKSNMQYECAMILNEISTRSKVVIAGIDLKGRVPRILSTLKAWTGFLFYKIENRP